MNELGGYVGRFLNIDLNNGTLTDEIPDEALLRDYIGGYGLGARVLYDRVPPGADPLGPENVLGFVTGPLTGTNAVMASRYCAVAKSPLTGGWGDANSGGEFGPALKYAGYDAVFVSGISDKPVYVYIDNGQAELRPADDLWGMDAIETEKALQERHGEDVRVACIGPAGEKLALISAIINDYGRAAGRSGLGAVMGSKRLKAVVARGDQPPTAAHPDEVKALRSKYLPLFRTGESATILREYGTAGFTKALSSIGRTPIKNWAGTYDDGLLDFDGVDGPAVAEYEEKKYACWHCVQACGAMMRWETDGEQHEDHRPEYETLALLGTACGIDDSTFVMRLNELCNRGGLDTISAGSCVAFAMECFEKELLTEEQLDGLILAWGDGEAALALVERIIVRDGLGDILADGVQRAAQKLGQGSEAFAIHSGGQELPAHDPRQEADFGLVYQMSPTPGRHTQGGVAAYAKPEEELLALGLDPTLAETDPLAHRAQAYAAASAYKNVMNASGLCSFSEFTLPIEYVPAFIAAVTGWDYEMPECLKTGERIEDIRLLFGLREGYNPLEVQVAPRAMGKPPLRTGPTAGVSVEIDDLRDAYLEVMAWDAETAKPSRERLEELGLSDLVAD
jgi:aldehyde:ferredoxin oxidoreductase